jgi:NhaC family Na+:H+ antiporter
VIWICLTDSWPVRKRDPYTAATDRREASMAQGETVNRIPTLLEAFVPLVVLVVLLALSVHLFGADSSYGANQIVLVISAAVAAVIGIRNGHSWVHIQEAVVRGISTGMTGILILLAVGALIGAWMIGGTVPAMIFYGMKILDPTFFFVSSAVLCAVASLAIGSSWTTAGTLGIGLIGVAQGLGLSPAATAGAVISGAYFGDKMSPLSDTTNLAPAVAGAELFEHIRHMLWTTIPAFVGALAIFTALGLRGGAATDVALGDTGAVLAHRFDLSLWTLVPLVFVFGMAAMRRPALPVILGGAALGALVAVWKQPDRVLEFAGADGLSTGMALAKGVWMALFDGYTASTGDEAVDALLSRGGMSSMLNTMWLVVCALSFGAVMEHTGLLSRLIQGILRVATSTGALISAVIVTAFGSNIVTADQYMSIVLPGRMFRAEFRRRRLAARNLSRAIEDAGTLTSPLVPWNTCGAYMSATLGVATLAYLPFCFFNLFSPLISAFYGFRGFTIDPLEPAAAADSDQAAEPSAPVS